ncbi:unnamed protein product [Gemmataceae bacterium]|nr:unnamed protein product [Gemmataceae bacterium]VTU02790.1 unnamed protein product [Gemmataceae bacterium]
MPVPKKKQTVRGAKRMREQGYKQVALWLGPVEAGVIAAAAKRLGMPVATWIREQAFAAAQAAEAERRKLTKVAAAKAEAERRKGQL